MKRRVFLELVGAGAAGAALARKLSHRESFRAWTWVHGNYTDTSATWHAKFARLRAAGISGVLVGGGDTAMIAAAAHAEGLTFHAWTWIMNHSSDEWVKTHHPEWFDVSRLGDSSLTKPPYVGYYQWLCPSRPEVRDYIRGNAVIGDTQTGGQVRTDSDFADELVRANPGRLQIIGTRSSPSKWNGPLLSRP